MNFSYGIIMGYYGPIWSVDTLADYADFCKQYGYSYFIYAPKEDDSLRKDWATPFTDPQLDKLKKIGDTFASKGIKFGIGLSPYGTNELDDKSRQQLTVKIQQINAINPSILGIFFDDIDKSSIVPNLAKGQVAVAEYAASVSNASSFTTVPTYYSHDQILQRVLGATPPNYFNQFGAIDSQFNIFWTGEHIISAGFTKDEITAIADKLQRKVTIWDNYPTNDPAYLADYLRIFGLTARADLANYTAGIALNPMLQPYASMLPLATIQNLYSGQPYNPRAAYLQALQELCSDKLATIIDQNLNYFILQGMKRTAKVNIERMTALFSQFSQGRDKLIAADFLQLLATARSE